MFVLNNNNIQYHQNLPQPHPQPALNNMEDIDIIHENEIYTNDRFDYLENVNILDIIENNGIALINRVRQMLQTEVIGRNVDNTISGLEYNGWSPLQIFDFLHVWILFENPFNEEQMNRLEYFLDIYDETLQQEYPNVYNNRWGDEENEENVNIQYNNNNYLNNNHHHNNNDYRVPEGEGSQNSEVSILNSNIDIPDIVAHPLSPPPPSHIYNFNEYLHQNITTRNPVRTFITQPHQPHQPHQLQHNMYLSTGRSHHTPSTYDGDEASSIRSMFSDEEEE
jgi:hypothetical protein